MAKGVHTQFLQFCKITCFGGSEKGECPCVSPSECELRKHPRYGFFKMLAEQRMRRRLRNSGKKVDEG